MGLFEKLVDESIIGVKEWAGLTPHVHSQTALYVDPVKRLWTQYGLKGC